MFTYSVHNVSILSTLSESISTELANECHKVYEQVTKPHNNKCNHVNIHMYVC